MEVCVRFFEFDVPPSTPEPLLGFFTSVVGLALTLLSLTPRADLDELVLLNFCTPLVVVWVLVARPFLMVTAFFDSWTTSVPFAAFVTSPRAFRLWPAFAVDMLVFFPAKGFFTARSSPPSDAAFARVRRVEAAPAFSSFSSLRIRCLVRGYEACQFVIRERVFRDVGSLLDALTTGIFDPRQRIHCLRSQIACQSLRRQCAKYAWLRCGPDTAMLFEES